jgi:hypothetical protein
MEKELKSVTCEGGNQVGKGDAIQNLGEYLSEFGLKTEVVQLPYYSTPFGYLVRDVLLNDIPDYLDTDNSRKLGIKLSLFALNRLEVLNCLECCDNKDVYLFDRGPHSCALTIAYDVSKKGNWDEEYIQDAIDMGLGLDKYFIDTLNIENCIVCLKSDGIVWEANRGEGEDLHESKDVQSLSDGIYGLIEKRVGSGWKNIVTKDSKGWRDRGDIRKEITSFMLKRGFSFTSKNLEKHTPTYLGLREIQESMYYNSNIAQEYERAWMAAVTSNSKKEVYSLAKDISERFVSTTERILWNSLGVKNTFRRILEEYPEIYQILDVKYGKGFLNKLQKSLG